MSEPKISEVDTVAAVATLTGVPRSTLQAAIARGELVTRPLAGGTPTLAVADVQRWRAIKRKPGVKPRS